VHRWQKYLVRILPFLVFRHPSATVSTPSNFHMISWIMQRGATGELGKKNSWLVGASLRFGFLLLGSLLATFFVVYICFSFNAASTFPVIGTSLYWWILARNILIIFLLHIICLHIAIPNRDRLAMLHFDMKKIDPRLAYVGVFHTIRKGVAWISRRPFRMRWFTTFLSDCILLGLTYAFYAVASIMRAVVNSGDVARILAEVANVYKGLLVLGFIMYSLEFYPKHDPGKAALSQGILLFIIAMNFADFFLFVGEKTSEVGIMRAFSAGAQLFITHSSVLLSAIIGNHHAHAHISPDFPSSGLWKLGIWGLSAGVWATYSVLKESYASDAYWKGNWIPISFPYVLWVLNVLGGVLCLYFAGRYSTKQDESVRLVRLGEHEATILDGSMEDNEHKEHEKLDYDIMLIVITFVLATVYFASEVFTSYALSEFVTMVYWMSSPLAPIGLAVLAATFWWKPPSKPQIALYIALWLASCYMMAIEVAEDCHLTSETPRCCEYPAIVDSNHHFETPHNSPLCLGLIGTDSACLISPFLTESDQVVFPVSFTAVVDTSQSVIIKVSLNGTQVFGDEVSKLSEILVSRTCRERDEAFKIANQTLSTDSGCYGEFLYELTGNVASLCHPVISPYNDCLISVQTTNCAFVKSDALILTPLKSGVGITLGTEAQLLLRERLSRDSEKAESSFYSLFKIIGMAALLECFFTLFGILLKLIFLSECRTSKIGRPSLYFRRRTTVMFEVQNGNLIPNEEILTLSDVAGVTSESLDSRTSDVVDGRHGNDPEISQPPTIEKLSDTNY
jgi:hypothetical protein